MSYAYIGGCLSGNTISGGVFTGWGVSAVENEGTTTYKFAVITA